MAEQDIREDQMTTVNSVDYVRGLKGNNSVLLSISDLFSNVVSGGGTFEGDANELTNPGMYYINNNTQNTPSGYSGLMIVFYSGRATAQIVYNVFNGEFRKRALLYNGGKWDTWSDWKTM